MKNVLSCGSMQNNKHEFSLYWSDTSEQIKHAKNNLIVCDDPLLVHRLVIVLRMQVGNQFIIFDYVHHAHVALVEVHKKRVVLEVLSYAKNNKVQPTLTMILPLLKRDALEQALYSLVEVGVTSIQLVVTEKVQRTLHQKKEYERLEKIIISACEQSKQYAGVTLHQSITLEQAMQIGDQSSVKLYADAQGQLVSTLYKEFENKNISDLVLMIGPEGDLTPAEKDLLKRSQFLFCSLTPTIVRSVQAAGLFAGIWRSLLR